MLLIVIDLQNLNVQVGHVDGSFYFLSVAVAEEPRVGEGPSKKVCKHMDMSNTVKEDTLEFRTCNDQYSYFLIIPRNVGFVVCDCCLGTGRRAVPLEARQTTFRHHDNFQLYLSMENFAALQIEDT